MSDTAGNNIDERLVGFDARVFEPPNWLTARRNQFLLRPEVDQPLSSDEMIWPSVFSHPAVPGSYDFVGLPRPDWIGRNSPLWEDLYQLTACLNESSGTKWEPCRIIAVSILYGVCSRDERTKLGQLLEATQPFAPLSDWSFLGYDVCDSSVLSGLMNCGYQPEYEDVQALKDRYAPHLNDNHLFNEVEHAAAFRLTSNDRVKEHSPFFVYGIYSIPSDGA